MEIFNLKHKTKQLRNKCSNKVLQRDLSKKYFVPPMDRTPVTQSIIRYYTV